MNALKDLLIYCQNNDLDPFVEMRRRANPTISVEGARPLTWEEVEALTGGGTGTFARPCPYCGPEKRNSKRFQIQRPQLNRATWHCFYCDAEGAASTDAPISPKQVAAARERERAQKAERTARALRVWDECVPIKNTPAIKYLRARGINDLPPNVDDVLRYHGACQFGWQKMRCLIALFRDVISDEARAIHRTAIGDHGHTLGRMALGPIGRAAIKLWAFDGAKLVIGEGIETTLAAALYVHRTNGEILQPAWAASVANNIKFLPLIEEVRRLLILVDHDLSGVGQEASEVCSRRYCDAGREVLKLKPDKPGTDFNDLILGRGR
jgi:hypothetical protein